MPVCTRTFPIFSSVRFNAFCFMLRSVSSLVGVICGLYWSWGLDFGKQMWSLVEQGALAPIGGCGKEDRRVLDWG